MRWTWSFLGSVSLSRPRGPSEPHHTRLSESIDEAPLSHSANELVDEYVDEAPLSHEQVRRGAWSWAGSKKPLLFYKEAHRLVI